MEYLKQSLPEFLSAIKDEVKTNVLCSSVVFPRTRSLQDKAVSTYTIDETDLLKTGSGFEINWEALESKITKDPELIGFDAVKDLMSILSLLKEVEHTLKLAVFDGIVIYRGGIDLLRIQIGDRKDSRSAYVEINDYRRQIHSVFVKQRDQKQQKFRDFVLLLIAFSIFIHSIVFYFK